MWMRVSLSGAPIVPHFTLIGRDLGADDRSTLGHSRRSVLLQKIPLWKGVRAKRAVHKLSRGVVAGGLCRNCIARIDYYVLPQRAGCRTVTSTIARRIALSSR